MEDRADRAERTKKVSIPVTKAFSMEIKFTRTPSTEKKGDFSLLQEGRLFSVDDENSTMA